MPKDVSRLTMHELVAELVPDGQQVLVGGFAYSDPMAFAHELIRQGRKELEVIKTSGGLLVDMLLGSGVLRQLEFCHVWNSVGPEPAHAFRRCIEQGVPRSVAIDELSYGAFTMGLAAAAWGLPFMPTTPTALTGHDLERRVWPEKLGLVASPFDSGAIVSVVRPIAPELGVFHVQRVDRHGNAQMFGPAAEFRQAMAACRRIVVIAEQLVSTEVIRERPELTIVPGHRVEAIVIQPWAAHPTDSAGYYRRDLEHHALYGSMTRTVEGFQAYVDEWIGGVTDHAGYLRRLGPDALASLRLRGEW